MNGLELVIVYLIFIDGISANIRVIVEVKFKEGLT